MELGVVARHQPVDHDGFGGTLFTNQQHWFLLFSDGLDEEVCPYVVHIWDEDAAILGRAVRGVVVLLDTRAPMSPLTWQMEKN